MRIRLDISYDGSDFHGWAAQPQLRTVQGELERALAAVLREPVTLTVAGRTDAGVHASGQVAHTDISDSVWRGLPGRSDRDPEVALVRAVNAVLARQRSEMMTARRTSAADTVANSGSENLQVPVTAGVLSFRMREPRGYSDVIVQRAHAVSDDFDARFSALWRSYIYRIADDAAVWNPGRRDVLWLNQPLDINAMNEAAQSLLGEHDFLAYAKPREGASTIRTLHILQCVRGVDGIIEAHVRADAFCHSQVRAMMGAIIEVGHGRKPAAWPGERLQAKNHQGMIVAPAHPLTLEKVGYPASPDEYGAQAVRARVYRG